MSGVGRGVREEEAAIVPSLEKHRGRSSHLTQTRKHILHKKPDPGLTPISDVKRKKKKVS